MSEREEVAALTAEHAILAEIPAIPVTAVIVPNGRESQTDVLRVLRALTTKNRHVRIERRFTKRHKRNDRSKYDALPGGIEVRYTNGRGGFRSKILRRVHVLPGEVVTVDGHLNVRTFTADEWTGLQDSTETD